MHVKDFRDTHDEAIKLVVECYIQCVLNEETLLNTSIIKTRYLETFRDYLKSSIIKNENAIAYIQNEATGLRSLLTSLTTYFKPVPTIEDLELQQTRLKSTLLQFDNERAEHNMQALNTAKTAAALEHSKTLTSLDTTLFHFFPKRNETADKVREYSNTKRDIDAIKERIDAAKRDYITLQYKGFDVNSVTFLKTYTSKVKTLYNDANEVLCKFLIAHMISEPTTHGRSQMIQKYTQYKETIKETIHKILDDNSNIEIFRRGMAAKHVRSDRRTPQQKEDFLKMTKIDEANKILQLIDTLAPVRTGISSHASMVDVVIDKFMRDLNLA